MNSPTDLAHPLIQLVWGVYDQYPGNRWGRRRAEAELERRGVARSVARRLISLKPTFLRPESGMQVPKMPLREGGKTLHPRTWDLVV